MPTLTMSSPGLWGLSGPDFLLGYLGLTVTLCLLRLGFGWWLRRGDTQETFEELPAAAVAYLRGGAREAALSALAALRARRLVLARRKGRLATGRAAIPRDVTRLELAVHQAIRRHGRYRSVLRDPAVRDALRSVDQRLTSSGLLLSRPRRAVLVATIWLLYLLLGVGTVRFAIAAGNTPVGYLGLTLVGLGAAVIGFHSKGRSWYPRTRSGDRALERLKSRYAHLAPDHRPSWTTGGAQTAAMSTALFGAAALYAADPSFAARLGMSTAAAGSSGSYSGGGGGGGTSTACGSGGGCGGGCGGGGG